MPMLEEFPEMSSEFSAESALAPSHRWQAAAPAMPSRLDTEMAPSTAAPRRRRAT